jgi:tRNA(fMet)-specific endonuclease VapC
LILLDTNTVVHYIKGNPGVVRRMQASSPSELAIPSIVVYELERGTLQSKSTKRRSLVATVLQHLQVVSFDEEAALDAARIHTELQSKGLLIGPMDLLIAGTARSRGAMLVTNNTSEFRRVKGLRTEDWRI